MGLEQIPVAGENSETQGLVNSAEKVDTNLLPEEANEEAEKVVNNSETMEQVNQLVDLGNKYKNGELRDTQKEQYENLMKTIKAELDKNVPTVIEMNQEIDVNYYNEHPEEAAKKATEIVNDYNNMNDVELVSKVVSRSDYLGPESKQKLYNVIQKFDNDIRAILDANKKENNSEK